jgi:hypothetical protein
VKEARPAGGLILSVAETERPTITQRTSFLPKALPPEHSQGAILVSMLATEASASGGGGRCYKQCRGGQESPDCGGLSRLVRRLASLSLGFLNGGESLIDPGLGICLRQTCSLTHKTSQIAPIISSQVSVRHRLGKDPSNFFPAAS